MIKRFENQYYFFGAMLLAIGDILALLLFTFFGTMEHQLDSGFKEIWVISFPFIAAWIFVGLITGAYRGKSYASLFQATACTIKNAVVAIPAGLLLRWLIYGKPATWVFALVAFAFVVLFLLLWRWAYTWLIRNI